MSTAEKRYLLVAFLAAFVVVVVFSAFTGGVAADDVVQAVIIGLAAALGTYIGRRIARSRS